MAGRLASGLIAIQEGQRGALMPWIAVCLGVGVGLYFAQSVEPGRAIYIALAVASVLVAGIGWIFRHALMPVAIGLLAVALGFAAAGHRAHSVAGPVLDFRYYGPIEGRIVAIDRSASDAIRLTLDQVRLDDVRNVPLRVRVALHGDQWAFDPTPGAVVMMTGHLSPPGGAAEPEGFDFQRHAWFLSLGGVGYTRNPVVLLTPPERGATPIFSVRMALANAIRDRIEGQPGAFAAAVLTGDRSGLEQGPIQDMRDSNIAHLLAISGLHMGLLTGFMYAAMRLVLALIPALALTYPIRKWAAVAALATGAVYLALSGGNVATERAFIQVAVMFTAVLLDRRAITLRSVAIAAIIVLLHRPETLMSPGFQMSFAATTALVAVFNGLSGREWLRRWPGWAKGVWALVVSSVIAGGATAPFAAAHFNRIAAYGLAANLLTVPLMGSIVIPFAVLAALLAPFGLSWVAFSTMEWPLIWILGVAEFVADLPGAVRMVPSPPGPVVALFAVGGLMLCLWRGRGRLAGLAPVALAMALWTGAERPDILISGTGGLVGVHTPDGRSLSRPRGDGFVARIWLENDGDPADQALAATRPTWVEDGYGHLATFGDTTLWHGAGVRAAREAEAACAAHSIVILNTWPEDAPDPLREAEALTLARLNAAPARGAAQAQSQSPAQCLLFTPFILRDTGAIALSFEGGAFDIHTASANQGRRLWSAQ